MSGWIHVVRAIKSVPAMFGSTWAWIPEKERIFWKSRKKWNSHTSVVPGAALFNRPQWNLKKISSRSLTSSKCLFWCLSVAVFAHFEMLKFFPTGNRSGPWSMHWSCTKTPASNKNNLFPLLHGTPSFSHDDDDVIIMEIPWENIPWKKGLLYVCAYNSSIDYVLFECERSHIFAVACGSE